MLRNLTAKYIGLKMNEMLHLRIHTVDNGWSSVCFTHTGCLFFCKKKKLLNFLVFSMLNISRHILMI